MDCHGTESDPHSPTRLEHVETKIPGQANLHCPSCGVTIETGVAIAQQVGAPKRDDDE